MDSKFCKDVNGINDQDFNIMDGDDFDELLTLEYSQSRNIMDEIENIKSKIALACNINNKKTSYNKNGTFHYLDNNNNNYNNIYYHANGTPNLQIFDNIGDTTQNFEQIKYLPQTPPILSYNQEEQR